MATRREAWGGAALIARGYRGVGGAKTCFLRNEPKCNVEESTFIWFVENELDRLQKNDKWVRFFEAELVLGNLEKRELGRMTKDRRSQIAVTRAATGTVVLPGNLRSIYVRGRETGAQQPGMATGTVALQFGDNTATECRGYKDSAAKAGIDLMNGFLYKCGGEWGICP